MNKDGYSIRFEDVTVNLIELSVFVQGKRIYLGIQELRLLFILLIEPYKVVSYQDLLQRADIVSMCALWVAVAHLRKKLGHRYIVTHHERGYSFVSPTAAHKQEMS